MDLERTGRLADRYRWIEDQLFAAMGTWSRTAGNPELQEHCAVQSQRHAWHAELWEQRRPMVPTFDPEGEEPTSALAGFMTELVAPSGDGAGLEWLIGVYRVVLPRLVGAYHAHLGELNPATDAPTVRVLTLVLRDEEEAWRTGELLLQSMITTPDAATRAAGIQGRLESLFVAVHPWSV